MNEVLAGLQGIDAAVLRDFATATRAAGLVQPARWVTALAAPGVRIVVTVLVVLFLAWRRAWRPALYLALSVPLGSVLVSFLKGWIARPRPEILRHYALVENASMPSGHAANGAMVWIGGALALGAVWPAARTRLLWATGVLVLLIGLSRLVLAVHWPSDVIAGWALGVGWVLLSARVSGLWGAQTRRRHAGEITI